MKAGRGLRKGTPGASPGQAPFQGVYPASSPAEKHQPIAPAVAASADLLNGAATASVPTATADQSAFPEIVRPSTVRLLPVFLAIALAPIASLTNGDQGAALKVVPRAAVPTQVALMAVALKGVVEQMVDVSTEATAPRLAGSLPSL